MREANLVGANFSGCDLRAADLTGARPQRLDLTGADLRGARADAALWVGATLVGAVVDVEQAVLFAAAHGLVLGTDGAGEPERINCRDQGPTSAGGSPDHEMQPPPDPRPQALVNWGGSGDVDLDRRGPFVQPRADVVGGIRAPLPFVPGHHGAGGRDTGQSGDTDPLPQPHLANLAGCPCTDPATGSPLIEPSS